jgi:hypothetical protein
VAAGVIGRDVQHGVAELRLPAGGAGALDAGPRPLTTVPMRLFEFAAPQMTMPQTVLYFFVANGRFVGMPEQVRAQVFDLRLRRAYWCKVELLVQGAADKAQLLATAGEFLEVAVPELLTCLPDARSLGADAGEPRPVSGRSAATVSGESGGARVRHDR